jgi:hypothetical protein
LAAPDRHRAALCLESGFGDVRLWPLADATHAEVAMAVVMSAFDPKWTFQIRAPDMPRERTPYQASVGRLISAIQKEWGDEAGTTVAAFSEDAMGAAHQLLRAGNPAAAREILAGLPVAAYLGDLWVRRHPSVRAFIEEVEKQLFADVR